MVYNTNTFEQMRMIQDSVKNQQGFLRREYENNFVAFTVIDNEVKVIGYSPTTEKTNLEKHSGLVLIGTIDDIINGETIRFISGVKK